MIKKWSEHFKEYAPINDKLWQPVFLCMVAVAFILAIFEPFAFRLNSIWQFIMLVGFVVLIFLVSTLFFVVIPRCTHSFFKPERWTNGRMYFYLLLFLLSTGFCVFIYEYVLLGKHTADEYWTNDFFIIFMIDMLAAVSIGLIPVTIFVFLMKNSALKKNLSEAIRLNDILSSRIKSSSDEVITLGKTAKESFSLNPAAILYIEAAGNYVDIVYTEGGSSRSKLLRSTIKHIKEDLERQPFLVRCHRAFIVNVNQVNTITGNAQGYKMSLNNTDRKIPVSRTYMKDLEDILN